MRMSAMLILLFGAAALGGCANGPNPPQPIPENPNPFLYQKAAYPFVMRFAANAADPASGEVKRLEDFLKASSARPGDTVAIRADDTPLGRERGARVSVILARDGLKPVPGIGAAPGGSVALELQELVAIPPVCGDWPVFAGDQTSNAPAPFLGCALQNNLYQMIVDKRDLVMGRKPGLNDAEPGMRAVEAYREGKSPLPGTGPLPPPGGASPGASDAASAAAAAANLANVGGGASAMPGGANGQ